MKILSAIEVVVIIVAAIYGIRWILNPDGQFEPIIAFCAILVSSIDLWRRHSYKSEPSVPDTERKPIKQEVITQTNKFVEEDQLPSFQFASSCAFFAQRFSQAFPGIRQGQWFESVQAVERLKILFEHPLKYSRLDGGWITPIGWQRDGNMTIDDFRVIDKNTVIIDSKELKVKRIYAGFMSNYKQLFVYLEVDEMPAIGIYEHSPEQMQESKEYFGYVWEEYGLYKGQHPVTRAEYDDNAAIIMGKPVKLDGNCEIRIRYLTPYNIIISASSSSINQSSFDENLKSYMNRMLEGEDCMKEFIDEVKTLPSALGY